MKKLFRVLLMVVIVSAFILSLVSVAAATEHDHDWKINEVSGDVHKITCKICSEYRMESHTYGSADTCIFCGYVKHEHDYQCKSFDAQFHTMACAICGYERTTTHIFNDSNTCTECGYTIHEHIWQYTDGENYAYNHGLHCTQCATITTEDHIYGNDGTCTVCGNAPPHEHQWEWDGNESNYLWDHFLVCSCGAKTTEPHQLYAWDGKIGNDRSHRELCGVCGHALLFDHTYDSTYYNGERCTVCGYPGQGTTVPETKPGETTPVETRPAESEPNETTPVETRPAESEPNETTPAETAPAETESDETLTKEPESSETKPEETESTESAPTQSQPVESAPTDTKPTPSETMPENAAKEDSQRSSSVWVWVAAALVVAGGLGTVVFIGKKKLSK